MKIHKILSLAGIAGLMAMASCFEDPGTEIILSDKVLSFSVPAETLRENDPAGISGKLEVTSASTQAITVAYEVTATGATAGVDFVIETASPVTIPAGSFSVPIVIKAINNTAFEPQARKFTFTITSVSDATYKVQANKTYTVTLINDDCPVNTGVWVGDLETTDDYAGAKYAVKGVGSASCNQLSITGDLIDGGAAGTILYNFTPSAPGATSGTVKAAKQTYCCPNAAGQVYTYEATGTYDEVTKIIDIDYIFYNRDGSIYWAQNTIIKPL